MLGTGSARVLESFEKLWNLKMPFSRTWNVTERDDFLQWLWKSFQFLFVKIVNISYNGCSIVLH